MGCVAWFPWRPWEVTECDDVRRVLLVIVGAGLLALAYGTDLFDSPRTATAATVGGCVLVGGAVVGALVGAGHARERRAWDDYQDARDLVVARRRAWWQALKTSAWRMSGPAALVALVLLMWKGGR